MSVETEVAERLDRYLIRRGFASSRRVAAALIAEGAVHVNGRRAQKGSVVARGDRVEVQPAPDRTSIIANPNLTVAVLHEEPALLIVAKPGLLPCHPLKATEDTTLLNFIAYRYPEAARPFAKPLEGGLVHRLDNGTSGTVMIARTAPAWQRLRDALQAGQIRRDYRALIVGHLSREYVITTPLAHHRNPRKMTVAGARDARPGGASRAAETLVKPLRRYGDFTLVQVLPRTGRRHQIRVHLASIRHPIVGDTLYGGPPLAELAAGRFWLHLQGLDLDSPAGGGRLQVDAPLAQDLRAALARAG
ncbi:MAG TPA: RluA family pseudouridine synthase [Candidatus Binataceae bacterium]|nr:RluA family pseudouridine synthase [Candidatus Binataceae bacterium]